MAAIIPAAAIGAAVGAELPRFFGDALDQFGSGEGIYLRDGNPSGIVARVGQAVGRAYCRSYEVNGTVSNPARALRVERACRPYLDSIGSPAGPILATPFQGGQCDCTLYVVDFKLEGTSASTGGPFVRETLQLCAGPLTYPQNIGSFTWVFTHRGSRTVASGNIPPCGPAGQEIALAVGFPSNDVQVTFNVTPFAGPPAPGPDNCGNPPPEPIAPPPFTDPQPPPFRFNPGPNIDIPIDIEIFPDGTIVFDIGGGPITVNPLDDSEDPGGPGEPPPDGPSDGPPGDVGDPGAPEDTGDGGESSGCAPEGSVLTGIRVNILEASSGARQYADGVFRAVCYAYLGVEGNLDHDPAGAMLRDGQFIFAEKDNLTCWQVNANIGYDLRITPYYRALETEE